MSIPRRPSCHTSHNMTNLVRLLILAAFTAAYGNEVCDTNTTIGSSCVASLVRDIMAVQSPFAYSDKLMDSLEGQVDSFLRTCLGAQAQPLRRVNIMVMEQARGRGAEVLEQMLLYQSGVRSNVSFVDIPYIAATVVADNKAPGGPYLDGFTIDPSTVVDLTMLGALAPLEEFVQEDPRLQWADVLPFFRQVATIYDGHLIAVPFTGQVSVFYYRKDVLAAANLSVPVTWDDLLVAATSLNGTDYNGDGVPDYAICWQMENSCLEVPVLFVQIAAPMLQSMGTTQGWMFDPDDMSLLLNSTAGINTLDFLRKFQPFMQPGTGCQLVHMPFIEGSCAFTIKWAEQFKFTELTSPSLRGKVGVVPLPGSRFILDRVTRTLQPCTNVTCPYARMETDLAGRQILVNRAPHFGFGGFAGSARKGVDVGYQRAVFNYFANLAGPELSWEYMLGAFSPLGPFRVSHVDPANLQRWTDYGYPEEDVKGFLSAWRSSIDNPNVALDIRIYKSFVYREIITKAGTQAAFNDTPLADILMQLVLDFQATYEESVAELGDRERVRSTYRVALGIASVPSTAAGTPQKTSFHRWLPLISLSALVLVLVLGLEMYCRRLNTGRRTLFGAPLAPKSGPDTTLLVASLPDLPDLLRDLPEPVVARALAQYLSLMRRLLRKYNGHEGIPHTSLEDVLDMASSNSITISAAAAAAAIASIRGVSLTANIAVRHNSITAAATAAAHASKLQMLGAAATAGHQGSGHAATVAVPAAADTSPAAVWSSGALLTPEAALACGERSAESWLMLCAFANPRDALRFAAAAQQGLMRLDWSPLLLQHRKCTPLYALSVQKIPWLSSSLTRLQSRMPGMKQEGTVDESREVRATRAAESMSADGAANTRTTSGGPNLLDGSQRVLHAEDESGRRVSVEEAAGIHGIEGVDGGGVGFRCSRTVTPRRLLPQLRESSFIARTLLMRHKLLQLFVPLSRTVSSTSREWSFQERMRSCATPSRPATPLRAVAQTSSGCEHRPSTAGPIAASPPGLAHLSAIPVDPQMLPARRSAIHAAARESVPVTHSNMTQQEGDDAGGVCRTPLAATISTHDISFASLWPRQAPWVCELPDPLAGTSAASFSAATSASRTTSFAFRIRPFSRPATTTGVSSGSQEVVCGNNPASLMAGPSNGMGGLPRRSQLAVTLSGNRIRNVASSGSPGAVDSDAVAASASSTPTQLLSPDADGLSQGPPQLPGPLAAGGGPNEAARPAVDLLQVVRMAHYYSTMFKVINLHGDLMSYARTNRLTSYGGGGNPKAQSFRVDAALPTLREANVNAARTPVAAVDTVAAGDTTSKRTSIDAAVSGANSRTTFPAVLDLRQHTQEGQVLLSSPFANPAVHPLASPDGSAVPVADSSSHFGISTVASAEPAAGPDPIPERGGKPIVQSAHPFEGVSAGGLKGTSDRALHGFNRISSGLFQCPSMRDPEACRELTAGHVAKLTAAMQHPTTRPCTTSGTGYEEDNEEPVPVMNVIFPTADASAAGTGGGAGAALRCASGGVSVRLRRCAGSGRGGGWQVGPSGASLGPVSSRGRSIADAEEEEDLERQLQDLGVLVQRGLRICMGLSSGLAPRNVSYNRAAGRQQYSGHTLLTARALSYAAAGTASRLLLSGTCFKQLGAWWRGEDVPSCTVLNIGEFRLGGPCKLGQPLDLYMPLTTSQGPCLAAHRRPRGALQSQAGVMEAPLGDVTIVFAKAVGVKALRAWDESEAQAALALFHRIVTRQLAARGGYLVELVEDLCLAAFTHPGEAVRWGLTVLSRLVAADWSAKLLEHELCEEVVISEMLPSEPLPTTTSIGPQMHPTAASGPTATPTRAQPQMSLPSTLAITQQDPSPQLPPQQGPQSAPTGSRALPQQSSGGSGGGAPSGGDGSGGVLSTSPGAMRRYSHVGATRSTSGNHITRVLYRGLRMRVGIDIGPVKAEINTVTGRVSYRGRAMNRASRISDKAPAGQVWVSGDVWRLCNLDVRTSQAQIPANGNLAAGAGVLSGGTAGPTSVHGSRGADPAATWSARRKLGHELEDDDSDPPLALAARYQGQHHLKGVQGPMDLWCCRFEQLGRSSHNRSGMHEGGGGSGIAAEVSSVAAVAAATSGEASAPVAIAPPAGALSEGASAVTAASCRRLCKNTNARHLAVTYEESAATTSTAAVGSGGGGAGGRSVRNLDPGPTDTDASPPGRALSAEVSPFSHHLPFPTTNQPPANTLVSPNPPTSRAASAPRAIASRLRYSTPATATFNGVTAADSSAAEGAGSNNQRPTTQDSRMVGFPRSAQLRRSTMTATSGTASLTNVFLSRASQLTSSLTIAPLSPELPRGQPKETSTPMMAWNVVESTEPELNSGSSSGGEHGTSEEHLITATAFTSADEPAMTGVGSIGGRSLIGAAAADGGIHGARNSRDGDCGASGGGDCDGGGVEEVSTVVNYVSRNGRGGLTGGASIADVEGVVLDV